MHISNKGYILCPHCGRPTKVKVNPDTVLRNFPLWCPWCKRPSKINFAGTNAVEIQFPADHKV